jgi:tetratricopeptide (TPR) repeat protein
METIRSHSSKQPFTTSGLHQITNSLPRYFILLLFLLLAGQLTAQSSLKATQDAFKVSYTQQDNANYTAAIAALKGVYDENSYEINLRIGWLHYLAGLFTESTAYYSKAIKLKPYAIEARFGFAYPAGALGNWDQVMAQYTEILKIDPQNTTANYRMGSIYYGKQDYSTAEKFLEKVVNLYPYDYDSNILYAWTNLKLGRLREAQVLFNKVLMLRPMDASALEGLSLIK